MSKEFSQFPSGAPLDPADRFLIGRADGGSVSGYSNYIVTLAQLASILGIKFYLEFLIGNGTDLITTGLKPTGVIVAPRDGIFNSWILLSADITPISGSIVIDIYKDTYANYPPTAADTITGSAKPTISSDIKNTSSVLTGWTTAFNAGDILIPNVDSVSGLKAVKLLLGYDPI